MADRVWPQGSEARLVAVRKDGPRDPNKDANTMRVLMQSAEELRATGLRVSTAMKDGQAEDALLQESREFSADCIFIDSQGQSRGLGNDVSRVGPGRVAEALALGAHCSVEIVRAKNLTDPYLEPAA